MNLTSFWQVFVSWRILAYPVFWLWCGPTTLSLREEHYPRYSHWEVHLGPNMLSLSEPSVDWRHLCLEHSCLYPECCTQWQVMALFSSKDFFVESLVDLPPRPIFLESGNLRNVNDSFTAVWLHSNLASLLRLKASCKLLIEYSAEINAFSWGKLFYLELVSRKKKKTENKFAQCLSFTDESPLGTRETSNNDGCKIVISKKVFTWRHSSHVGAQNNKVSLEFVSIIMQT